MRLVNQASIVTGAASGIGKAIAQTFAREGAAVAIPDIHAAQGEAVAAELKAQGARACFVPSWRATSRAP